ncbi:MAG TPA: phosphotransferase [Solirubrobacteraceae bacterium]|nr:phosphotransferase [Solirubrobacteraceae bacterium]
MTAEHEPMTALARAAMARFEIGEDAKLTLVNVSENHTFRVDDAANGMSYALRLHRPGYRTVEEIESEIDWIDALRRDGVVDTPAAVSASDGGRVVFVEAEGAQGRNAVVFRWIDGSTVDMDAGSRAIEQYETLGAIAARMHQHVRRWQPRPGFTRPPWDYEHSIGPAGHWGAWQDGLGVGPQERRLLDRLDTTIRTRLQRFGAGSDRFGLVHADMRLANLLVHEDEVLLIDFDDCGASWYMYDFATTVSFMEDHPRVPELRAAWLRGYRSVAKLDAASEAELQTLVMLRRLLLVAWIGSHHTFAPEAAELGSGFTAGTCALAEEYLSTH